MSAMNCLLVRIAATHADRPADAAALCDAVRLVCLSIANDCRPPASRVAALSAAVNAAQAARIARDAYAARAETPRQPVEADALALCELVEA